MFMICDIYMYLLVIPGFLSIILVVAITVIPAHIQPDKNMHVQSLISANQAVTSYQSQAQLEHDAALEKKNSLTHQSR
jgi:hypothetical protein